MMQIFNNRYPDEYHVLKLLSAGVHEEAKKDLPGFLSMKVPDHQILGVALAVQEQFPKRKTVMISRDINMRVIADALNLETQDYQSSEVVSSRDAIYEGFQSVLVDDEDIDAFYDDKDVYLYMLCGCHVSNNESNEIQIPDLVMYHHPHHLV